MVQTMSKYPAYKDSGVEWLGEIPEHWEVKKITHIFDKIGSGTTPTAGAIKYYDNGDINFLQTGDLTDGLINSTSKRITNKAICDFSTLKIYPKSSLVVAMYGATIGKVGFLNIETTTNQACCVLGIPNNFLTKYGFYWFIGAKPTIISMSYGGGQPNISQDLIKSLRVCVPPLAEQTAIANFLDNKTALIDKAIALKEKQIELLKERRQILIHRAVTRGIGSLSGAETPDVKLKNSGVEWIGEIPEHWEVKRLKEICKAFGRIGFRGYTTSDLVDEGEGAITISPSNIKDEYMTFEKSSFLKWEKYDESPEIQIFDNDILMVKTGSTFGKIGIVKNLPQKATINPQLLVLKDIKMDSDYFYTLLKTSIVQKQVQIEVIGSTIPTISETKIMNFKVAVPQQDEINMIMVYINNIKLKISTAITLKEKEIEKLKEYKSVLINEAVSGKIKVV